VILGFLNIMQRRDIFEKDRSILQEDLDGLLGLSLARNDFQDSSYLELKAN